MSKLRDAAQQALEALEAAEFHAKRRTPDASIEVAVQPAITALRAALAEQPAEQEPVAWCDVAGFESYEVSSNGDLRNKRTGRIMDKNLAGAGYVKADLWANGQRKKTTVHRLVAEAFLGPAEGREVNHKNGNKQDNRVSNLEWCSCSKRTSHGGFSFEYDTAPQPRKRLTDEDIDRALQEANVPELPHGYESVELEIARAIEAAVWGEKT